MFHQLAALDHRLQPAGNDVKLHPDAQRDVAGAGKRLVHVEIVVRLDLDQLDLIAGDNHGLDLLTTEKDAVNLCREVSSIIHPLNLWWLEIGMDIDRRDELVSLIREALKNI